MAPLRKAVKVKALPRAVSSRSRAIPKAMRPSTMADNREAYTAKAFSAADFLRGSAVGAYGVHLRVRKRSLYGFYQALSQPSALSVDDNNFHIGSSFR